MSSIVSTLSASIQKAATAGLIALTVSATLPALAQQKAVQKPAAPVAAKQEEESSVPNEPNEQGIKVHGHWVIDVKDKDGKVVDHRDFQNSLASGSGPQLLALLLSGAATPSNFGIDVGQAGAQFYHLFPTGNNASHVNCPVVDIAASCVPSLTVNFPVVAGNTLIVLQGQFTAISAVTVNTVSTAIGFCNPSPSPTTISPSTCANNPLAAGVLPFTAATVASALAVAAGQTLAVTVTLSFS